MLSVDELIDIDYIPNEEKLSLNLLVEFYEQYLSKRIYIFDLENDKHIKLSFNNIPEIFHVTGITHIYQNIPMTAGRFVADVKKNQINFRKLKTINSRVYKDYIDRICSFACINTVIKNCDYLWFQNGIIPNSSVKVQYLLLKGIGNKNIHLGIDSYGENRPFFPKTLLITEGSQSDKFVNRADNRIKVSRIEIRDKATDELLEEINRQKAAEIASMEVIRRANKWLDAQFVQLIECESILRVGVSNTFIRKEWKPKLKKHLLDKKPEMEVNVRAYDPYWAKKLVAEKYVITYNMKLCRI